MIMEPTAVPWRAPGTYSRPMGGKFVIEGYIDAYSANDVARSIWSRFGTGITLGEIAANLTDEYEVDQATALDDVVSFAERLVDLGYITFD
jgi:hypothetical protein